MHLSLRSLAFVALVSVASADSADPASFPGAYLLDAAQELDANSWRPLGAPVPTTVSGTTGIPSGTSYSQLSSSYTLLGAQYKVGTQYPNDQMVFPTGLDSPLGSLKTVVEFYTDAETFEFVTKREGSPQRLRLWVDHQLLQDVSVTGNSGEFPRYVKFNFGSKQDRHVRLEQEIGGLRGIRIPTGSTIRPVDPATHPRPRCIVMGDSFTEGVGASFALNAWAGRLAEKFGWDVWMSGSGGTGYLNPGVNGRKKFRDRVQTDVIAHSPDIVIVAGGINDSTYTRQAMLDEASALFDQIHAGLPDATLVVIGPWFPNSDPSSVQDARSAIKEAAEARNLIFLDPTNPASPWIKPGNKQSYHPVQSATGTAQLEGDAVSGVTIQNGGGFYAGMPTITFSGGGGSGASATPILDGRIRSITVLGEGSGYDSAATVEIIGGGGSGAAATPVVVDGQIKSIEITSPGTGYIYQPQIAITGKSGLGSTAAAVAALTYTVTGATVTAGGSGYTANPTVTFSAPADATHPRDPGHAYYAERVAYELIQRGFASLNYAEWRAHFFSGTELADDSVSGPDADPDLDGIPNLFEYGIGGSPLFAGTAARPQPVTIEEGPSRFPGYQLEVSLLPKDLSFEFETCSDLSSWEPVESVRLKNDEMGTVQTLMLRDPAPLEQGPPRFTRMRVELNPE